MARLGLFVPALLLVGLSALAAVQCYQMGYKSGFNAGRADDEAFLAHSILDCPATAQEQFLFYMHRQRWMVSCQPATQPQDQCTGARKSITVCEDK